MFASSTPALRWWGREGRIGGNFVPGLNRVSGRGFDGGSSLEPFPGSNPGRDVCLGGARSERPNGYCGRDSTNRSELPNLKARSPNQGRFEASYIRVLLPHVGGRESNCRAEGCPGECRPESEHADQPSGKRVCHQGYAPRLVLRRRQVDKDPRRGPVQDSAAAMVAEASAGDRVFAGRCARTRPDD